MHTPIIVAKVGVSLKRNTPISTDSRNSTYLKGAMEEISTFLNAFSIQYRSRLAPIPINIKSMISVRFIFFQVSIAGMSVSIDVAMAV